ncbi:MAG: hypothetical protein NTV93_03580 [Verrucomicrobia bacterium]|nr:hypothetical protein [Verrucomicrobiota bacterium]
MKLRTDLLKFLTEEDIADEAAASVHRFNPTPLFSKTGTGSLTPATEQDKAEEIRRSEALVQKLKQRLRESQQPGGEP